MENDSKEISKCDLKLLAYKLLPEIKKYKGNNQKFDK